jgi:hypothetical protein
VSLSWRKRREVRLAPEGLEAFEKTAFQERLDVTVVLSNHFARYTVVPPQEGASAEEEVALARFQFARIHGERAKAWEVRISRAGGGPRLACAIDASLLERLKARFPKGGRARLASVQPALMAAYNALRKRIPRDGAWLLLTEPGRSCLARVAAQGWGSVHNGHDADWEGLIERERSRAGGVALPTLVLKHAFAA